MKYSPPLDGLRGVAILCVMMYHAGAPFLSGGFVGVDVFFVLSGFLITSLLIHEFDESGSINLKNFYARRVLRLTPALVALLVVFCAASRLFLSWPKAHGNYVDTLITLLYLTNWRTRFLITSRIISGTPGRSPTRNSSTSSGRSSCWGCCTSRKNAGTSRAWLFPSP